MWLDVLKPYSVLIGLIKQGEITSEKIVCILRTTVACCR